METFCDFKFNFTFFFILTGYIRKLVFEQAKHHFANTSNKLRDASFLFKK